MLFRSSLIAVLIAGGATLAGLSLYLVDRASEIRAGQEALRAQEVDEALVTGFFETDEGLRASARAA